MLDRIKDYIGWWMLIPAFVIIILQVPGCVEKNNQKSLQYTKMMTEHCASQGKTYLAFPQNTDEGLCI